MAELLDRNGLTEEQFLKERRKRKGRSKLEGSPTTSALLMAAPSNPQPQAESLGAFAPLTQVERDSRLTSAQQLQQAEESDVMSLRAVGMQMTLRARSTVASSRRRFVPAGQSTQLIVGATPEDDNHILQLSNVLYQRFDLKRVFFSAYMPMVDDARLPEQGAPVPLRREHRLYEHRLYQADWLMRYYAFSPDELATPEEPWLDLDVDPKLAWALRHIERFPVEVMDAPIEVLLRVPGVGPVGARRIITARKAGPVTFDDLARMRITLKRARHFLTCGGKRDPKSPLDAQLIREKVVSDAKQSAYNRTRRHDRRRVPIPGRPAGLPGDAPLRAVVVVPILRNGHDRTGDGGRGLALSSTHPGGIRPSSARPAHLSRHSARHRSVAWDQPCGTIQRSGNGRALPLGRRAALRLRVRP